MRVNRLALPCSRPWIEVGSVSTDTARLIAACAWLRLTPGASSKDTLSEANWSLRLMRSLAEVRV